MTGHWIGIAEEAIIADLTAKLAESQAREAKLREALNTTLGCVDVYYIPALKDEFALADAPHDDTALKEYRKKVLLEVIEEWKKPYGLTDGTSFISRLHKMAEE